MEPSRTSFELLSHFDLPTEPATTEGVLEVPAATLRPVPVRGSLWVLTWAAAIAIVFFAATQLVSLAFSVKAEMSLGRIAQAAAYEATLPRATMQTVRELIRRHLQREGIPASAVHIAICRNGAPVLKNAVFQEGDRIAVALALPFEAAMPEWVRSISPRLKNSSITAESESRIPTKYLVFCQS